ncbi:MAG: hypothetical protein JWN01_1254 [Patescibacteria group bacterium]|jgi:hypothetical protein|nr:hypothetical protein [Patescibacteria group bacterium]
MKKAAHNTATALAIIGLLELVRYLSLGYELSARPANITTSAVYNGSGIIHAARGLAGELLYEAIGVVAGPVDIVSASTAKPPPPKPKPKPVPAPKPAPVPAPAPAAKPAPVVIGDPTKPAASTCPTGTIKIALPIQAGKGCVDNTPGSGGAIVAYLKMVLTLLAGAVGGVIMLMLVVAGIQYITSIGDPAAIKSAKNRIVNAITGLVLFLMMYAILNFLVPGGIL